MTKKGKTDALTHVLLPKHTKVSEREAKALLKSYCITVKELPKISKKDPAIAHLDVESGDIIRIDRKSVTAGTSISYRTVIN